MANIKLKIFFILTLLVLTTVSLYYLHLSKRSKINIPNAEQVISSIIPKIPKLLGIFYFSVCYILYSIGKVCLTIDNNTDRFELNLFYK